MHTQSHPMLPNLSQLDIAPKAQNLKERNTPYAKKNDPRGVRVWKGKKEDDRSKRITEKWNLLKLRLELEYEKENKSLDGIPYVWQSVKKDLHPSIWAKLKKIKEEVDKELKDLKQKGQDVDIIPAYKEWKDEFAKPFPEENPSEEPPSYDELKKKYNLDWKDVAKRLDAEKRDWRNGSEEEKQKASDEMKKTMRLEMYAKDFQEFELKKKQWMHQQEKTWNAENNVKYRYRALLRLWFGKAWWKKSPETVKRRKDWAIEQVKQVDFEPLNPPTPPWNLWDGDTLLQPISMQEFPGPPAGLQNIEGNTDGIDVVLHVKSREYNFTPDKMNYDLMTKGSMDALSKEANSANVLKLRDQYDEFIEILHHMGVKIKDVIEINVASVYTDGSGRFNRTLDLNNSVFEPLPTDFASKRDLANKMRYSVMGSHHINYPETPTLEIYIEQALKHIHRLWKLIYMAPRLSTEIHVLRSVKQKEWATFQQFDNLKPGQSFLSRRFESTTFAAPEAYLDTQLSTFYDQVQKCCFMAITLLPGTPCLPIGLQNIGHYIEEKEVILPPLTRWIFTGKGKHNLGGNLVDVWCYTVSYEGS